MGKLNKKDFIHIAVICCFKRRVSWDWLINRGSCIKNSFRKCKMASISEIQSPWMLPLTRGHKQILRYPTEPCFPTSLSMVCDCAALFRIIILSPFDHKCQHWSAKDRLLQLRVVSFLFIFCFVNFSSLALWNAKSRLVEFGNKLTRTCFYSASI